MGCHCLLPYAFAIETVLFDGKDSIEITGLPKETTIDSVKIAITVIRNLYPDLLKVTAFMFTLVKVRCLKTVHLPELHYSCLY